RRVHRDRGRDGGGEPVLGARPYAAARLRRVVGRAVRHVPAAAGEEEPDGRTAMTETASERIRVEAPADRCFDVAIDFESYPEWAKDVKSARILETDGEGRGTSVEFRAAALGRSIRYVLDYDYSDAPEAFSWQFREGDMLKRLDGRYRFEPEG